MEPTLNPPITEATIKKLIDEAVAFITSPEGQQKIEEASLQAEELSKELAEMRKIYWQDMLLVVTI